MDIVDSTIGKGNLRYPPRCLNTFIRKLDIHIALNIDKLNYLRKLGSGSMGFENLRDVETTIWGSCAEVDVRRTLLPADYLMITRDKDIRNQITEKLAHLEVALKNMPPILMNTKSFRIKYEHADTNVADGLDDGAYERLGESWEMPLLQKFVIGVTGRVEGQSKRFEPDSDMLFGLMKTLAEEWPVLHGVEEADLGSAWGPSHASLITIKKMWAR